MDLCLQNYNNSPSCCWERADCTALSGIARSCFTCWKWLFQSPDVEILAVRLFTLCFKVFGRWHQHLWFKRWEWVWGDRVESCKIVFLGTLPVYSFRHFFRGMYKRRLITMSSVTDRQTDRQRDRRQCRANSRYLCRAVCGWDVYVVYWFVDWGKDHIRQRCVTGPPGKPKGPIEVLDVQKDSVLISWKPPEDDGGKPLT